jgi:hypothetical protein
VPQNSCYTSEYTAVHIGSFVLLSVLQVLHQICFKKLSPYYWNWSHSVVPPHHETHHVHPERNSCLSMNTWISIKLPTAWSLPVSLSLSRFSPKALFVYNPLLVYCTVLGFYFTMELYCTPKSQYTTVKHSRKLFEHTYTSDPHGLRTLTPIEFFQRDLLWQSSNTPSHSCSQKAFKHTSGQSIVGLSVRLHTTTAPRRIVHH